MSISACKHTHDDNTNSTFQQLPLLLYTLPRVGICTSHFCSRKRQTSQRYFGYWSCCKLMFGFDEVETDCKDVLDARQQHLSLLFVCFHRFPLATVESNDYNQGDTRSCASVKIKTCKSCNAKCKKCKWKGEGGGTENVNDCLQAWQAKSVCLSMFAFMYRCEASRTNKRTETLQMAGQIVLC